MEENYKMAYDLGYLQALKDFAKKLHIEVLEAMESNFKAKKERVAKSGEEDGFTMYCDGKIHALDGIDYFTDNYVKDTITSKKLHCASFYGVMLGIKRKEQESFIVDIEKFNNLVEVVRCKDCKYEGTAGCPTYYEDSMTYRDCWALDGDNDFCSYGERKEK